MNKEILQKSEEAVALLKQKNLTVSVAESCTGGLVSAYITAVSGASDVFEMGLTSYSNRIKNEILGVSKATLDTLGAVSEKTATQMAENMREKAQSDIGLSVTGVAGPNSSEGHAPGLVHIAMSAPDTLKAKTLNIIPKNRNFVRETAVLEIFNLLINYLKEK